MLEEGTADITPIDDLDQPPEPEAEGSPEPEVPAHLVRQPCGLPKVLMIKNELTQYEKDHGIDQPQRKAMEITPTERDLYEAYVTVTRGKGVTKEHFVAALRLSHAGFDIWPSREKDLNEMKVH